MEFVPLLTTTFGGAPTARLSVPLNAPDIKFFRIGIKNVDHYGQINT